MKNRKHTRETLPAYIRTRSSRKLAGTAANKPKHGIPHNSTEAWDKSRCACGTLAVACPWGELRNGYSCAFSTSKVVKFYQSYTYYEGLLISA